MRTPLPALLASLLLPLSAGCGSGSGTSSPQAPSGLSYSANPASYTQGFAITPNVPSVDGTVATWSIAPALPSGLSFDSGDGTISGTPLVTAAAADYTVTASNSTGSDSVAVSIEVLPPQPRNLYVANFTDSTVGSFHVGSLIHSGYALSNGTNPRALAARADGAFVYAANDGSNDVTTFAADPISGRLEVSGGPVAAGVQPEALATEPTGQYLFCANRGSDSISVFTIDAGAPVAASTSNTGVEPVALAVDPSGAFLYAANSGSDDVERFSIDAGTGALTTGGIAASPGAPNALAIATTPAGSFLYVVNSSAETVGQFSIEPGTGALTPLAPATVSTGVGTNPQDVVAHPEGTFVYVSYEDTDEVAAFAVDQAAGTLTPHATTPTLAVGDGPSALAIGTAGARLFVANQLDVEVSELAVAGDGGLSHVLSVRTRSTPADLLLGPAEMAFQVTSNHAYVASFDAATVSQYEADPPAGTLTDLTPASVATAQTQPRGLALHQEGTFAVASSEGGLELSLYARDPATGLLTSAGTQSTSDLTSEAHFEPSGRFLYVTLRALGVQPFEVDAATPALTPLTSSVTGGNPLGFDLDPTGQFLYLSVSSTGVAQFRINAETGELTSIGTIAADGGTSDVGVHPSGRWVYASNGIGNSISMYAVNPVTGALSNLTPFTISTGSGSAPDGIVLSSDGADLYVALRGTQLVAHYDVDPDTGQLTFADDRSVFQEPRALGISAGDAMLAVANFGSNGVVSLFTRDPVTGALSASGFASSGDAPSAVAFPFDIQ